MKASACKSETLHRRFAPRGNERRLVTQHPRRSILSLAAGAAALPAVSHVAWAQAYPTRPITIIAPLAAGGALDATGRVLAERMRRSLGQPVRPSTTFLAEHWKHLRTTNVIESSFATIRHRTVRSKGCLSNKTALAMIFKLAEAAERSWRRLDGHSQLPKLILGVKFTDGIEVIRSQSQAAAA